MEKLQLQSKYSKVFLDPIDSTYHINLEMSARNFPFNTKTRHAVKTNHKVEAQEGTLQDKCRYS